MKTLVVICACLFVGAFGATIVPFTTEEPTVAPLTLETTSAKPMTMVSMGTTPDITINPVTAATSVAPTIGPVTAVSTPPIITINPGSSTIGSSTPVPQPSTTAAASKFDGGAFAGGIALGVGISILGIIGYTCYSRRRVRGYDTM